jgi:alpha-methylacyl-CoA racemase
VNPLGPLHGLRVIEIASIGPGPYCGMMLADLGAEVIRVERESSDVPPNEPLLRNRQSIAVDLKSERGREIVLRLVRSSQVLFEGFRPGVMERLRLGPTECMACNGALVYGRVTGWGQSGPLSGLAGHDINYLAITGYLNLVGPIEGKPVPPLNVVGDFAGGGLLLAFGIMCALHAAQRTGKGQVVDAAMIDGVASFLAMFFGFKASHLYSDTVGANALAGAAPNYDVYETKDGKYLSVAPLETKFLKLFLEKIGLPPGPFLKTAFPAMDLASAADAWPGLKECVAEALRARTREEWRQVFDGSDACVAPVLNLEEAMTHPHHLARGTFTEVDGIVQNAPAPRFSVDQSAPIRAPVRGGHDTRRVLRGLGYTDLEIADLTQSKAVS